MHYSSGSLVVIGGCPLMGKTAFCLNLIERLCYQNKSCLYFSNKETKEILVARLAYQVIDEDFRKELQPKMFNRIIQVVNDISHWNLFITAKSSFTCTEIKKLLKKQKPDYVFLDFDKIPKNLKTLKKLAQNCQTIMFVTANLGITVNDRVNKQPILENLANFEKITQYTDEILLLHRPYYYDCDIPKFQKTLLKIIHAKSEKETITSFVSSF